MERYTGFLMKRFLGRVFGNKKKLHDDSEPSDVGIVQRDSSLLHEVGKPKA